MTKYSGGLLNAIDHYLDGKSNRKFGLLIIDEQAEESKISELTVNMVKCIGFAKTRDFKVVMVEINPPMTAEKRTPTRRSLAMHLPKDTDVFFKRGFNAFGVIDSTGDGKAITFDGTHFPDLSLLDGTLRGAGVNELIVMGRQGSQCVKRTVIGGVETSKGVGPNLRGALDYGYQVWTSPKIVYPMDEDFDWYKTTGLKCYEAL